MEYVKPQMTEYGSLADVTAACFLGGETDEFGKQFGPIGVIFGSPPGLGGSCIPGEE